MQWDLAEAAIVPAGHCGEAGGSIVTCARATTADCEQATSASHELSAACALAGGGGPARLTCVQLLDPGADTKFTLQSTHDVRSAELREPAGHMAHSD